MFQSTILKRELILATVLIGFGWFLLPVAVYWVGRQVIGEYESTTGFWGLIGHVWSDFLALAPGAWLLVLSPYVVIQLLRLAHAARRSPRL